jgi:hypothetical protein
LAPISGPSPFSVSPGRSALPPERKSIGSRPDLNQTMRPSRFSNEFGLIMFPQAARQNVPPLVLRQMRSPTRPSGRNWPSFRPNRQAKL